MPTLTRRPAARRRPLWGRSSRAVVLAAGASMLLATPVRLARAEPTPEQLRTMYDDAMRQLQQAQDRKNQLANENEQLKARLGDLQKQLTEARAAADPFFDSRSRLALLEAFIAADVGAAARFEQYDQSQARLLLLLDASNDGVNASDLLAADWPFVDHTPRPATSPATEPATTMSTTQATTLPATAPATTMAATAPATAPTTAP